MTDRELLELAAKAAGIDYISAEDYGLVTILDSDGDPAWWWNPLTDDGDALRLAVKLDMELDCNLRCASVYKNAWHDADDIDDYDNAMRVAIVRAAAELGKELE